MTDVCRGWLIDKLHYHGIPKPHPPLICLVGIVSYNERLQDYLGQCVGHELVTQFIHILRDPLVPMQPIKSCEDHKL